MQRPNMTSPASSSDVEREPLTRPSAATSFSKPRYSAKPASGTAFNPVVLSIGLCLLLLFAVFHASNSKSANSFDSAHHYKRPASYELDDYNLGILKPFRFAIVADLDRMSFDDTSKKPRWKSVLRFGKLSFEGAKWTVTWNTLDEHTIISYLGEAGRGMELSELIFFEEKLLAFDDRSGVIFELTNANKMKSRENQFKFSSPEDKFQCIPRYILTSGDGLVAPKGQKTEWATNKDGKLYVGSFGKEYTLPDGGILHRNNLWVSVIDEYGRITHEDWTERYELLRVATGTTFPGYMIHEAIHFNEYLRKWVVLPRRVSKEPYDEKEDEKKGSNLMILVNEKFDNVEKIVPVGDVVPERGFSSFKFVPGTDGKVILALKTVENENKATGESEQYSFVSMFDLTGEVLMPDQRIPGGAKFEGLEFV